MAEIHKLILQHGRDVARRMVTDPGLVDIAAGVMSDESEDTTLSHAAFAMTCLPHREPQTRASWQRKNGKFNLAITPGELWEGDELVQFGLPFGSRARLILFYLTTRAVQTNERRVEIGKSLRQWMQAMNIPAAGKNYDSVIDQAKRITACSMLFGWSDGKRGGTNNKPFKLIDESFFQTRSRDELDARRRVWENEITLTDEFFQELKKHPVPLQQKAIASISNNSLALDIYVWLAYRLFRIEAPTTIAWGLLRQQFRPDIKAMNGFRRSFKEGLALATAVYPDANVDMNEEGLILKPSRPAVPERKIVAIGNR